MEALRRDPKVSKEPFTRRLGEAGYGPKDGPVGQLDLLASAGLPVLEGVVLTEEAHREFMDSSGLLQILRASTPRRRSAHHDDDHEGALRERTLYLRRTYRAVPLSSELNRALCTALIELGAPSVIALSQNLRIEGLKSIPEVRDVLREAWLSAEALERQIDVVVCEEEIPTWPVLVQREASLLYTALSSGEGTPERELEGKSHSNGRSVVLYDLEPAEEASAGNNKSIAHFALAAESLLGGPLRIRWGLEGGRWYMLSAQRAASRENW
jgi:hypothetical protein